MRATGLLVCLVGCALMAADAEYQPKPIPHAASAYCWRAFNASYRAWLDAEYLATFRTANAGKPWLAAGEKIVERDDQISAWVPGVSYPPDEQKRDVDRVVAAGCDDAYLLACAADFADKEKLGLIRRLFQRSAAAADFASYPAQTRYYVRTRLLELAEQLKQREPLQPLVDAEATEAWAMLTAASSDRLVSDRRALELLGWKDDGLHDRQRRMRDAKSIAATLDDLLVARLEGAHGEVTPWVRDTLLGVLHVRLAWDARGTGWAKTVTPEGWKGFGDHLARAQELLIAAWKAKPDQPFAATEMITVSMARSSGPGEERMWFDRAVAAHFDFGYAYDALRSAYQPRWGGDYGAMVAIGIEAAETHRYDCLLPQQLLDSLLDVDDDLRTYAKQPDAADRLWADPDVWSALKGMFDGYRAAKDRPVSWDAQRWDSRYAACAWKAGDRDLAARVLAGVAQPEDWMFKRLRVSLDEVRAHVAADKHDVP